MRPLRLELSGFSAFRDPVTVDFSDAEYFALVGPTGAGKSSVIDAMCFALYGSIPRLDVRSVAPVIAQGMTEARVRLDFSIGDTTYTAVRVVRRVAADRATTKEARLERGEEVLAGDADGVTAEVERLLGLGFQQFTRCVVLPQGEFARFMHDTPAARQDLLVKLLDLDVYERMQQRANQRAARAEGEHAMQRRRLEEDFSFATPEALAQARAVVAGLEALHERIEAEEPRLAELRETVRLARDTAAAAQRASEALASVRVPDGLGELSQALDRAEALRRKTEETAERAGEGAREAARALESLPARGALEGALEAHERRAALVAELERAGRDVDPAEAALAAATAAAAAADEAVHAATNQVEAARRTHRAHDLVQTLVVGEPCPVCAQAVSEIPPSTAPPDLGKAERALAKAQKALASAAERRTGSERTAAQARARVGAVEQQLAGVDERLTAHPDPAAAREMLAAVIEAEKTAAAARMQAEEALAGAQQARALVKAAEAAAKDAGKEFDAARDRVADLSPPPPARENLGADWRALAAWAVDEAARRSTAAEGAAARALEAEDEGGRIAAAQREACVAAGIKDPQSPRDDCIKALERQRGAAERIEIALEESQRLREEVAALEQRTAVARALGQHLKASAFERWVLRQALAILTDGATQILRELSAGGYSLALDKNYQFAVIDHRNADAARSARTLSGGETFLASLALALAMADRIAQLSANTAVRLESIFLDEGFGALDPETLDVVAAAIETLASNRIVGIVTHVRDLAERIPVRFEVRRGPATSTVEKVIA